jgi:thioredoxin-related protein
MSRNGILAFVFACVAVLAPPASQAALDFTDPAEAASDLEIVVVEAPGCIYCHLFRRDVWPFYENSQRAKSVPMRFVDLNSGDVEELALESPIESVPTALVLRQNKEVGRIPGYVGPESFFHSIDRLLASTP